MSPGMPLFGKRIDGFEAEQQPAHREAALLMAASILTLERTCCAEIVEVSAETARLRGSTQFAPGDDLWIKVGCIDRLVTVTASHNGVCEISFETPLTHEEVIHLRCEARNTLVTRLAPEERIAAQAWIDGLRR